MCWQVAKRSVQPALDLRPGMDLRPARGACGGGGNFVSVEVHWVQRDLNSLAEKGKESPVAALYLSSSSHFLGIYIDCYLHLPVHGHCDSAQRVSGCPPDSPRIEQYGFFISN